MHRHLHVVRPHAAPVALHRPAKVVALESRREARLGPAPVKHPPYRPAA